MTKLQPLTQRKKQSAKAKKCAKKHSWRDLLNCFSSKVPSASTFCLSLKKNLTKQHKKVLGKEKKQALNQTLSIFKICFRLLGKTPKKCHFLVNFICTFLKSQLLYGLRTSFYFPMPVRLALQTPAEPYASEYLFFSPACQDLSQS